MGGKLTSSIGGPIQKELDSPQISILMGSSPRKSFPQGEYIAGGCRREKTMTPICLSDIKCSDQSGAVFIALCNEILELCEFIKEHSIRRTRLSYDKAPDEKGVNA